MRFLEYWTNEIWPRINADFDRLQGERPAKQTEATGGHYGHKMYELLADKKEVRNVSCNLCWTAPTANTVLQEDITLALVENFALDMFMDNGMLAASGKTSGLSAGSADPPDAPEAEVATKTHRDSVMEKKRVWKVPARVPRFYNIPIAIFSTQSEPTKGEFQRFGMDCAVNGVWLAYYWAKVDDNREAIVALERLILDWPFDFQFFEEKDGETQQERVFKAMLNIPLETERLRDHFGMDGKNLMLVCAKVRNLLKEKRPCKSVPSYMEVHEWMTQGNHINWGLFKAPSSKACTTAASQTLSVAGCRASSFQDMGQQCCMLHVIIIVCFFCSIVIFS